MARRMSLGMAERETRPHILYRFYDRTNVLLYVGITVNLGERIKQHAADKDWWAQVDRSATRIEYFDGRRAARDAEREAIKGERPLHNDQHNEWVELTEDGGPQDRRNLALEFIAQVMSILGEDVRVTEAREYAHKQLRMPPDLRSFGEEADNASISALELAELVASDVWRLRYAAQMLIEAVPEEMRWAANEAATDDYEKAGLPDAPWEDRIVDTVRHLSYLIATQHGRPKPKFRGLRRVA